MMNKGETSRSVKKPLPLVTEILSLHLTCDGEPGVAPPSDTLAFGYGATSRTI